MNRLCRGFVAEYSRVPFKLVFRAILRSAKGLLLTKFDPPWSLFSKKIENEIGKNLFLISCSVCFGRNLSRVKILTSGLQNVSDRKVSVETENLRLTEKSQILVKRGAATFLRSTRALVPFWIF